MKDPVELDIHELLASRHEIGIIWNIADVKEVRPDLSEDQCWSVLQFVEHNHDATIGISWFALEFAAEILFGDAPSGDE